MTAPTIHPSAAGLDLYRTSDQPGLWPYRGQVAAVGIGHSPTLRNWDGDPQTSVGGWVDPGHPHGHRGRRRRPR